MNHGFAYHDPMEDTPEGQLLAIVKQLEDVVKSKNSSMAYMDKNMNCMNCSDSDEGCEDCSPKDTKKSAKDGYKSDRGDRKMPDLPSPKGNKNMAGKGKKGKKRMMFAYSLYTQYETRNETKSLNNFLRYVNGAHEQSNFTAEQRDGMRTSIEQTIAHLVCEKYAMKKLRKQYKALFCAEAARI